MQVPFNDLRRAHEPQADALRAAFDRVLRSGSFILGDEVRRFEQAFAAYCGATDCVGVASGSDALELALRAVGVAEGDRVATVANAAMYTTVAIRAIGATPVYVDVDEATLTMSPASLASAQVGTLRAIVVTHLYGRLADMQSIAECAAARGIPIVEDCAQAHGAMRDGTRAGAFGTAGCFSFYPTKNLGGLGDGGAVTTRDRTLSERVRSLRQYGWSEKYRVTIRGGRNSRLDELQAALLNARLPALDRENARRRAVRNAYAERIRHDAILAPVATGDDHVAHLAVVRCAKRDALREHLRSRGIAADVHYPIADHRQPTATGPSSSLPVTERACDEVLSLPCFAAMTDDEVDAVVRACNAWRC